MIKIVTTLAVSFFMSLAVATGHGQPLMDEKANPDKNPHISRLLFAKAHGEWSNPRPLAKLAENLGIDFVTSDQPITTNTLLDVDHKTAIKLIGVKELEEFGKEINSWGAVDIFAGFLAGPTWQHGQVSDDLINDWAHSEDRWWRRTALVCTVALNRRSMGGTGDTPGTLNVCRLLVLHSIDKEPCSLHQ